MLALRQVAKAHGMADVARRAKLGEKLLFKAPVATQRSARAAICRRSCTKPPPTRPPFSRSQSRPRTFADWSKVALDASWIPNRNLDVILALEASRRIEIVTLKQRCPNTVVGR